MTRRDWKTQYHFVLDQRGYVDFILYRQKIHRLVPDLLRGQRLIFTDALQYAPQLQRILYPFKATLTAKKEKRVDLQQESRPLAVAHRAFDTIHQIARRSS